MMMESFRKMITGRELHPLKRTPKKRVTEIAIMQVMTFMCMRIYLFMVVIFGAIAGGNSAFAQITDDQVEQEFQNRVKEYRRSELERSHRNNDAHYQRFLAKTLMPYIEDPDRGTPRNVFWTFSQAYFNGSRYDPFGQETITALKDLAMAAQSSDNSSKADEFRSLLQWHLPNYTVLEGVMPLVRENPALGDIEILEWMHNQITDRLLSPGGHSMEYSVAISSIEEAEFVLSRKAKRVIDTEVHVGPGDTCYHIHTVESLQPEGPEKIYIQYSLMVRHVIENYEIPTMPLKLPTDTFRATSPYCMYPFVAPDVPERYVK